MNEVLDAWPQQVHEALRDVRVGLVAYVPDAGHTRLIELCRADPAQRAVVLSRRALLGNPAQGRATSSRMP